MNLTKWIKQQRLPNLALQLLPTRRLGKQNKLPPAPTMAYPSFTSIQHHESYPAIDPTRLELSAAGKVILISGGGKGIGGAITSSFARAGAKDIIITGRDRDALEACKAQVGKSSQSRVHVFVGDVRDEKATKEIFATVKEEIGLIDVLVSNAGYLPKPGPVKDTPIDDFWRAFEINVKGATMLVQGFLGSAAEDAVLIDINAGLAHVKDARFPVAPYAASKAAFTRVLDFVRQENPKLRVYSLHPGLIKTDMTPGDGVDMSHMTWDDSKCTAQNRRSGRKLTEWL